MFSADLDPASLLALHVLLEEGQVTRAAARLGLTQSSMSHRLGRLRQALKDPLFVRVGGSLVPTPRAVAIRGPLAAALVALAEAVAPPAGFDPAADPCTLRLAMPDLLTPLLPRLLSDLASAAPRAEVRIYPVPTDLAAGLAAGHPAMAIAPQTFADGATRSRSLGELRFGVAVRRGHTLCSGVVTTERWLSNGHVVVQLGNERANLVGETLARLGLERRVALEVPSFLAGLLVVAGSDLVLNAPIPLIHSVAEALGVCVLPAPVPLPTVPFALLWHERFHADQAHRWMRERVFGIVRGELSGDRAPQSPAQSTPSETQADRH